MDRRIARDPAKITGDDEAHTGIEDRVAVGQRETNKQEGQAESLYDDTQGIYQPEYNDNPLRRRIWSRRSPIVRLVLAMVNLFRKPAPKTAAEKQEFDAIKERKKLEKLLRDEARLYTGRIISALNRLGLCYRYPKTQQNGMFSEAIQSVNVYEVYLGPDAIWLRIDIQRLPRNVRILDLMDMTVLTDLSLACGRKVSSHWDEVVGAWYIVERVTGVRGVPIHVKFQDMMAAIPASSDEMTIPLGMGVNSKKIYRSLKDMPHLLIAGSTNSGKSNMMNVILGALLQRNSPDMLKMILVDLKGGMEFTFFEGVPHLIHLEGIADTGIVYDREHVPDALQWLINEGERRMELIKRAGHKNITKYNAHRKKKLYRILLVVDEWADVRLARSVGAAAEDKLSNLAARMRAVGIHVIVATQSPKREVISTIIKTNLPAKMAFSCPSNVASELIIDNGDAKGLAPQGRFIWQHGEQSQIQSPYMPDQLIHEIVDAVKEGKMLKVSTSHDVTLDEVLEYCLDVMQGDMIIKRLFEQFRERGLAYDELISWLKKLDNQIITIRENQYRVIPGSGKRPRKLELSNDDSNSVVAADKSNNQGDSDSTETQIPNTKHKDDEE